MRSSLVGTGRGYGARRCHCGKTFVSREGSTVDAAMTDKAQVRVGGVLSLSIYLSIYLTLRFSVNLSLGLHSIPLHSLARPSLTTHLPPIPNNQLESRCTWSTGSISCSDKLCGQRGYEVQHDRSCRRASFPLTDPSTKAFGTELMAIEGYG